MPKINKLELPTVTLDMTGDEIEALSAKLATEPMSPEGMIETAIYLRRQIEKAEDLNEAVKVLAGRLKAFYGSLKPEQRDTRRVKVGMATYTEAGEKIELKDRDFTVENLTAEQLRITYKPDLKSMEDDPEARRVRAAHQAHADPGQGDHPRQSRVQRLRGIGLLSGGVFVLSQEPPRGHPLVLPVKEVRGWCGAGWDAMLLLLRLPA
jgi:hypothetical protein